MTERQCFPCTACCEGWLTSSHVDMSPGNPCKHCTSQGCAIYESRPVEPCVNFKCAWLKEPEVLPENMRPDLSGAIVMFNHKWQDWTVIKALPRGDAIPGETLEWLKALASKKGIPLLFQVHLHERGPYSGFKVLGYGPPAFLRDVENAIGAQDILRL